MSRAVCKRLGEVMNKIVNALLFQACWFSAVMHSWELAMAPLLCLLGHSVWKERGQHDYLGLAALVTFGLAFDTFMFQLGIFVSPSQEVAAVLGMPLWLMAMWCAFSLTLSSSLSWYTRFPRVFIGVTALAGPLSYWGGMRLGALTIEPVGFVLLAFEWGLIAYMVVRFLGKPKSHSAQKVPLGHNAKLASFQS